MKVDGSSEWPDYVAIKSRESPTPAGSGDDTPPSSTATSEYVKESPAFFSKLKKLIYKIGHAIFEGHGEASRKIFHEKGLYRGH